MLSFFVIVLFLLPSILMTAVVGTTVDGGDADGAGVAVLSISSKNFHKYCDLLCIAFASVNFTMAAYVDSDSVGDFASDGDIGLVVGVSDSD